MVSAATPPTAPPSVRIKHSVFRSDLGRTKKVNEDGVLSLSKVPLWAVADGTGGPEPARIALTALKDEAAQLGHKNAAVATSPSSSARLGVGRFLEALFKKANAAVLDAAEAITDRRIATTLVAVTIVGQHAFVAHVGDSRVYLFRQGKLRCLTNDHTLAAMQLRRGDITVDEFKTSPFRRTLAQAIGMSPAIEVDVLETRLLPGDTLVVTSNGLNRALSDAAIEACLAAEGSADQRADLLVAKVHDCGAPDNTTFVLVELDGGERRATRAEDLEAMARTSFLLRELGDAEWHQMQPYLELVEVRAGEVLCRHGEAPIGCGVLAAGQLETEKAAGERQKIDPGFSFGALALASDDVGYETVHALRDSVLYVLTRPRLAELQRLNPALGGVLTLSLLEHLGNRLATLTSRLGHILDAANGKL